MKDRAVKEPGNNLTVVDLLAANVMLGVSKAAAVVPTQPLQVVMRMQQGALNTKGNPQFLSAYHATKRIYTSSSFSAFFRGAGPGASKELLKNGLYKGALITGAPDLSEAVLSPLHLEGICSPTQYQLVKAVMAGTIAASGDVVFGGALESWATFRSTSHGVHANASFWKEVEAEKSLMSKLNRAYRGAGATTLKGTVAFSTFFLTASPIKRWVVDVLDVQDQKKMPWYASVSSALLSGGTVALTSSPFDIIKTQSQMPNPSNTSIFQAFKNNYQAHGMRSITAGLPIKFVMITMGWAITNFATQRHDVPTKAKELVETGVSRRL